MAKIKLRFNTKGAKAGDVVEVDQATADYLVENGNALHVKAAVKKAAAPKSEKG